MRRERRHCLRFKKKKGEPVHSSTAEVKSEKSRDTRSWKGKRKYTGNCHPGGKGRRLFITGKRKTSLNAYQHSGNCRTIWTKGVGGEGK